MPDKNIFKYALFGAVLLSLTACNKNEDDPVPETPQPISFATELTGQAVTRATYPLYYYQKNFKIKGIKTVSGATADVFKDYWVEYLTDDKSWQYVSGQQNTVTGQIERYWDPSATQYRFIAGAPYNKTSINGTQSLTLNGLVGVQSSAATVSTPYLFSEPKQVLQADFGNTVMLTFHLALCRIKLKFYYDNEQTDDVALTGITFGPMNSGSYAKTASMTINYDWTKIATPSQAYTQTVTPATSSSAALDYSNITLTQPCTDKTEATDIYYMIPYSSTATVTDWLLTIGSLTEHNTAQVPAEYMKWEPGHEYVYVFKLSSAKVDSTIKFVTCLKSAITSWKEASNSDSNLYNW